MAVQKWAGARHWPHQERRCKRGVDPSVALPRAGPEPPEPLAVQVPRGQLPGRKQPPKTRVLGPQPAGRRMGLREMSEEPQPSPGPLLGLPVLELRRSWELPIRGKQMGDGRLH